MKPAPARPPHKTTVWLSIALVTVVPLRADWLACGLAKNFVRDQKVIWTKPLRLTRGELAGVAVFSAVTAAFIATDRHTSGALPNTPTQIDAGKWLSNAGIGLQGAVTGGFLLAGYLRHEERVRETGFLAVEAAADSFFVGEVIKLATRRQRPYQDDGRGRFFSGGMSFPSGHALMSWAMAEVFASEYRERPAVRVGAYGLAALVSVARFPARKHFLSDILAGSTGGLLIGRYVWQSHHGERRRLPAPSFRYDPRWRAYSITLSFAP